MIVRFPDKMHAGTVIDSLASLADIYPTILDMAGVSPDAGKVHGESLLPLIEGRAEEWREHVVTEFSGVNSISLTQRTLRWEQYKYGYNCCGADELYDLALDPHETANRIDAPGYRDTARELRRRLAEWMKQTRDPARHVFRKSKQEYYDA
jgi:arylsulfatase A-like enzyme